MLEFASLLGSVVTIVGAVWLIIKPGYAPAAAFSIGLGVVGWSLTLGAVTFAVLAGLTLLFGNPFAQRRRTSISTGRPEGERTGSSPSNTP
jgi:membrane protein implicated in regulation of membrane protease activity